MQTQLYDEYQGLGGKIVDFHGWMMPIQFSGIMDEHQTVRERVGIFDVSHMGTLLVKGEDAGKQLQSLCTNDIMSIDIGKSVYTHILNDDGNIIDDNIIFRTEKEEYMIMPNASMIDIIFDWIQSHMDLNIDPREIAGTGLQNTSLQNLSNDHSILAIQGPKAMELLTDIFGETIQDIPKFNFAFYTVNKEGGIFNDIQKEDKKSGITPLLNGIAPSPVAFPGFDSENTIMVSRTGYTGEDGVELITRNEHIVALWRLIMSLGKEHGIKPIGLGARDTLRLEMGYLLSGQDFDGSQSPLESNCSWVVKWDHEFSGKDHLVKQKEEKTHRRLVGVALDSKAAARPGAEVFIPSITPHPPSPTSPPSVPVETKGGPPEKNMQNTDSQPSDEEENTLLLIGTVTSGNYSPTLGKAIALARIDRKYAKAGTPLLLQQGRRKFNGVVTRLPFINNEGSPP